MLFNRRISFLRLLCLSILALIGNMAIGKSDADPLVVMRTIGYQILQMSDDTTGRVLPIEQEHNQFRIRFTSRFQFEPGTLSAQVDSILSHSKLSKEYLVQVLDCESKSIVYSYQIFNEEDMNLVPCSGRLQPIGCYQVVISLNDKQPDSQNPINHPSNRTLPYLALGLSLCFVPLFVYVSRKSWVAENAGFVSIGSYLFNPVSFELMHKGETITLTSKEANLLELLHNNLNVPIERGDIMNSVWGDQGTYDGRTLDVYISKLRKHLSNDESIKIINVRGVGYKLVLQ